ncbi:MAG: biotin--[acetyl-CoA-carboxylase] ligase [Cytophagales bacterium]|nr:biotin--[acetyl-CoA-carboxylase] ligase [Bernardetiaceae bacterium]MDW8204992.1 biotin--[acetyl-CoA-carboxylase] ligase [Cytophagales bacterium]
MYKIIADTLFTGKKVVYLPACQSTNDIAAELIEAEQATEGTVVVTDNQTNGRGQRGNHWQAAPRQNLTLSVIWTPSFLRAESCFALNMAIALAVAETVSCFLPHTKVAVKWANDIYAEGTKISGILIENILQGSQIKYSIVGIGLNVNQTDFHGIAATSLRCITGKWYDLNDVFCCLICQLEKYYLQLQMQGQATIKAAYLRKMYRFGEYAAYTDLRGDSPFIFRGTIEDVDAAGRLVVRTTTGTETFELKQIQFNH